MEHVCRKSGPPSPVSHYNGNNPLHYLALSDCGLNGSIGAVYNRFLLALFDQQAGEMETE